MDRWQRGEGSNAKKTSTDSSFSPKWPIGYWTRGFGKCLLHGEKGVPMAVSGVSANCNAYAATMQSRFKQRQQDFQSLADALQAGNLPGAQQAFAALQKDRTAGQGHNVSGGSGNQQAPAASALKTDFDALQSAVQSGDLSGAQKALTTFQQDLQHVGQGQGYHRHHHPHGGGGESAPQQTIADFVSGLYGGNSSTTASASGSSL